MSQSDRQKKLVVTQVSIYFISWNISKRQNKYVHQAESWRFVMFRHSQIRRSLAEVCTGEGGDGSGEEWLCTSHTSPAAVHRSSVCRAACRTSPSPPRAPPSPASPAPGSPPWSSWSGRHCSWWTSHLGRTLCQTERDQEGPTAQLVTDHGGEGQDVRVFVPPARHFSL